MHLLIIFSVHSLLVYSQISILCLLSSLICISKTSSYILSSVTQLPDGILLFFIAHNAKTSANELNSNWKNKYERAYW